MLGKRPRPMIGKLSELLVSRGRALALLDTSTTISSSPRDMKTMMQSPSPRGLKNYDLGGVGLGIVVALDSKSNEPAARHAVCTSNLNLHRSGPVPVYYAKNNNPAVDDDFDVEEYTYVTCYVPNKTFTKVYYDGGEGEIRRHNNNNVGVLKRTIPQPLIEAESSSLYPTSNFLSSCHLCGKKLHGKDIYMYRGEKAFCSTECRSSQIMMDERKERCRSEASRSVEMSSSPYTREQIFSTGILAL